MSESFVLVETRGRVGLLTLNRPKAPERAERSTDGRTRRGPAGLRGGRTSAPSSSPAVKRRFAAGADIGAMKSWTYMDVYSSEYITRNWETLKRIRKPVIAAVAGYWAAAASWR